MNDPTLFKTLELHYYFQDESHSMDAYVRNKCETEFLAIVKEIGQIFGVRIKVESTVAKEGGIIDLFTFLSENQYFMTIVSAVTIKVLGDITVEFIKKNPEEEKLKLEKLRVELHIAQRKLNETNPAHTVVNVSEAASIVAQNSNILKHRSELYKQLDKYHKVTKISYGALNAEGQPIRPRMVVQREIFEKFITEPDSLTPIEDPDADIEIISPVLKRGRNNHKYKWRGIYGKTGKPIDFFMDDKKYEEEIYKSGLSFKTGTVINCVLKIERKVGENGEELNTGYSVVVVNVTSNVTGTIKTTQGIEYNKAKLEEKRQLSLFPDNNQQGAA